MSGSGATGATATCSTGMAVGGGFRLTNPAPSNRITGSFPVPDGWRVTGTSGATYTVYVLCAG